MDSQITLPLEIHEEDDSGQIRYDQWLKESQLAQEKFKLYKTQDRETYFLSSDSMKCLMCGKTIWSPIQIKARYCLVCNIYHEGTA